MTGSRDAAAIEAAQLRALRDEAEQRRKELGETVAALADKVAGKTDPRSWARHGAEWAAAGAGRAAWAAVRHGVQGSLGNLDRSTGDRARGRRAAAAVAGAQRISGRATAVIGVSAALVAVASAWWLLHQRPTSMAGGTSAGAARANSRGGRAERLLRVSGLAHLAPAKDTSGGQHPWRAHRAAWDIFPARRDGAGTLRTRTGTPRNGTGTPRAKARSLRSGARSARASR